MAGDHGFLIEVLPRRMLVVAYGVFGFLFLMLFVISNVPGVNMEIFEWDYHPVDTPTLIDAVKNNLTLVHKANKTLTRQNQDVFWTLIVSYKPAVTPVSFQMDLQLGINKHDVSRNRTLHCPCDKTVCGSCTAVPLSHQDFVTDGVPDNFLAIHNPDSSGWVDWIQGHNATASLQYKWTKEEFTNMESYVRVSFCIACGLVSLGFFIRNHQINGRFRRWALEQKWTFIILLFACLFDNPLFLLVFNSPTTTATWWATINSLCMNAYLVVYMFGVLVMTDNQTPRARKASCLHFYVPKFCLLGSLFLTGAISFAVIRNMQAADPAVNDITNVQYHGLPVFQAFVGILVGIYLVWLLYLVVRVIQEWSTSQTYYVQRRVKVLWGSGILMLAAITAGLFKLVLQSDEQMRAPAYFTFFSLYNLYPWLLAVMYWPVAPAGGTLRSSTHQRNNKKNRRQLPTMDDDLEDEALHFDDEEY